MFFVVDGGWGVWSPFTNCCNGIESRARVCDSPSPSHGGLNCSRDTEEIQASAPEACNGKNYKNHEGIFLALLGIGSVPVCLGETTYCSKFGIFTPECDASFPLFIFYRLVYFCEFNIFTGRLSRQDS